MNKKTTAFDAINALALLIFAITILFPFVHLFSISLSSSDAAIRGGLHLLPENLTFINYEHVMESPFIWIGYRNTIIRTVCGTALQLFATSLGAYVLSKPFYPHKTFWTFLIVFTMFFSGGLIPSYLLVQQLGLFNTYWAMFLPGLISAYNLVLMRNYFASISRDVEESCMIDGANQFVIYSRIIIPISMPIVATIALWLMVGHWNSWFDVLLYIRNQDMYVLQIVLRRIILEGTQQMLDMNPGMITDGPQANPESLKAAAIFVATVPILCVYPFIQKYFVKGIMVGSLKG
jgi:putative aldouronate transport system permease protein